MTTFQPEPKPLKRVAFWTRFEMAECLINLLKLQMTSLPCVLSENLIVLVDPCLLAETKQFIRQKRNFQ